MRSAAVLALLVAARVAAGACLDDCRDDWGGSGPDYEECVLDCGVCGNGDLEGDEECDDGNVTGGDCCDATCLPEPAGSPCQGEEADDDELCTTPMCDGDGDCEREEAPAPDCRWPAVAGAAKLVVRDVDNDGKDLLVWKWKRGAATAKAEFGDPTAATAYALCVYDATGALATIALPAGGECGARPCWDETPGGFRYHDRTGEADGAVSLVLRQSRRAGRSTVLFEAAGENLDLPDLAALASPLTVQLRRSGSAACWAARYTVPPARRHGERHYRDRSDAPPAPTSTTVTTTTTSTAPPAPTSTTTTTPGTTPPGALVEVTVLDADAVPVGDAEVTIVYDGGAREVADFTDAAGTVAFAGEPVGVPATITAEDDEDRTGTVASPGFAAGTNRVVVTVR